MRISDWSSDVCSSDLLSPHRHRGAKLARAGRGGRGTGEGGGARLRLSARFRGCEAHRRYRPQLRHHADPTPAQQAMSDVVMDAFVRFARTGDPGWPAYDLAKRQTMIFAAESRVESDPQLGRA